MTSEQPGVYADASPLIALALIRRLDLLQMLAQPVWVTNAVWDEVAGDPSWPGAETIIQAEADGIITWIEAGDGKAYPQLGEGRAQF